MEEMVTNPCKITTGRFIIIRPAQSAPFGGVLLDPSIQNGYVQLIRLNAQGGQVGFRKLQLGDTGVSLCTHGRQDRLLRLDLYDSRAEFCEQLTEALNTFHQHLHHAA